MSNPNQRTITVTPAFIDGTLKYIELSSLGMKRATDELDVHRAMQKKAADERASVLDYLKKAGVIPAGQEKQAEAMLADHSLTYVLLKNAVDKYTSTRQQQKQAGDVGKSVSETEAGLASSGGNYNSVEDGYVGRRTSEKKASDIAILAVLDAPK